MPNQYEIYECSSFSLIFTDTIPCSQLIADDVDSHSNLSKINAVATAA